MFKIAFKNLLRNSKRSILTIIIIIVATAGMTFGISWINGEENIIIQGGKKNTGDIMITPKDYEMRIKTLDISSNFSYSKIKNKIEKYNFSYTGIGRIKFGGLVYFNEKHQTALGTGIESLDYDLIGFEDYLYEGRFIKKDDEIIIGESIKRNLNLKLGDVVTILTQTQDKSLYSLNYRIVGFYKMDNSRLNRSFYIPLSCSQYLLDMEDRVVEFLLFLKDDKNILPLYDSLLLDFNSSNNLQVKKWDEVGINESMGKMMKFIKIIFVFIFSILSALSISNTMLMTVFERKYEIGLLKSLGIREGRIKKLFLLEGIYMGIIGSFIGIAIGSGIAIYLGRVGVNFGDTLEKFTTELNVKGVIYPIWTFSTVILTFNVSILTSILATFMAISNEVKKEAIINMRNLKGDFL